MLFLILILGVILSMLFLGVGLLLSKKGDLDKEKGSCYECGFESFVSARIPFSLQFFLIGVIFLVFDVEIVLMLPVLLILDLNFFSLLLLEGFVGILLFGLYFEWKEGSLEWVKWMGI